jgi:nicotinamidase-related amidase
VVDYQNDFVSGSLGFPGAADLAPLIAGKIYQYRENGDTVLFTFDTHDDDYLFSQEGINLPVPHCLKGTDGHKLFGQVGELLQETDQCFYKPAFGSGELFEYLKATPFQSIELAGLVSNICVIANAILAKTAQPDTPIIVDPCCTASHDSKLHAAALEVMAGLQIKVR